MLKEYKLIKKYRGYFIAKGINMYAIFTSELVNATEPLACYLEDITSAENFIDLLIEE